MVMVRVRGWDGMVPWALAGYTCAVSMIPEVFFVLHGFFPFFPYLLFLLLHCVGV